MKCGNCGAKVGRDAPFCPICGADLSYSIRSRRRFIRNLSRATRQGISTAVIIIAAICLVVVALASLPPEEKSAESLDKDAFVIGSDYIIFDDRSWFSVKTVDVNGSTGLFFRINDDKSWGFSEFRWILSNDTDGTIYTVSKSIDDYGLLDASSITDSVAAPGRWTLTAICSSSEEEVSYITTYEQFGNISKQYSWQHGGKTFAVSYTVKLSERNSAASSDEGSRYTNTVDAAARYVQTLGAASELESKLWSAYSAGGGTRTSADYVMFLLGFIDSCLQERDDTITYDRGTYWAYPVETLYAGGGDSGDLSVLLASMMKSAGIECGIVGLPGCWCVAVGVDADPDPGTGYAALSVTIDRIVYWITYVPDTQGIGIVSDAYSYDEGFYYHGEPVGSECGIRLC